MSTSRNSRFRGVLVGLLFPAVVHLFPVPSRGEDLPGDVLSALRENAAALTRLTVSWEQRRSSPLGLDQLLKLIGRPDSRAFFYPQQNTVIYQEGKLWYNTKETQWVDGQFVDCNNDDAFDGKLLYVSDSTQPTPPVLVLDLGYLATHNPDYYVYYCDYLKAAGFKVHNRYATIHRPPESALLYLLDQGGQILSVRDAPADGHASLAVEVTVPQGREVFFLDPSMRYAVRRREKYTGEGDLAQLTVTSEFAEMPSPQVWLPKRCRVSDHAWHTLPGRIFPEAIVVTSIVVTELGQKTWPPERFVIDYSRPGTFVLDSREEAAAMPGAVLQDDGLYSYRIGASPEDLARTVAVARSRWRMTLVGLCPIVVALACLLVVRQYRKRTR